jgi:hypothetical protein
MSAGRPASTGGAVLTATSGTEGEAAGRVSVVGESGNTTQK